MEHGTPDVLVVGAGFAGIAAALRLRQQGLSARLLEARDRTGGRAWTDHSVGRGVAAELGALMVHGDRVVTHRWARSLGQRVVPFPMMQASRMLRGRRIGRYPGLLLPGDPVVGTRAAWQGMVGVPRAMRRYAGPDLSLADFLSGRPLRPGARLLVELLHAHVYAADADEVGVRGSIEEADLAPEPFGFRNHLLVDGYSALVERAADVLAPWVELSTEVVGIDWSGAPVRVRARTPAASGDREYRAPHVLVTVPLGVLRAGAIAFDPPLPPPKREAIRRLGVGDAFALTMRFTGSSLRPVLGDFRGLWGGGASTFLRPRVATKGDELVTVFTVGREARRRGALDDPGLVAATLDEWTATAPAGASLGDVAAFRTHRWTTDPFSRGAYSFLPPGATIRDREQLGAPLGDRLFFAGEATDAMGEAATVPGAIASGERAAAEILRVAGRKE